MLQGALALAFFADAHWQKRFPPDETGEARKLRHWIARRMNVCKWVGLALLLLQVRPIIHLSMLWHPFAVSTTLCTQTLVCMPSVGPRSIQRYSALFALVVAAAQGCYASASDGALCCIPCAAATRMQLWTGACTHAQEQLPHERVRLVTAGAQRGAGLCAQCSSGACP